MVYRADLGCSIADGSLAEYHPSSAFDARFREALGHYPTGVVVVTGTADDGEPVGMVIGSFTSVSMDPPLVAFLPRKSSRTFERLRTARSFCINVLAADQEQVCRTFTSAPGGWFPEVEWRATPSGAPVLADVLCWIDCEFHGVNDGGDHLIVLGRVTDLCVERNSLPLLFFQRGYGRFAPGSLIVSESAEFINSVRLAELASDSIDLLASELGVECSVIAPSGTDTVAVATANHAATAGRTRLGLRVPNVPPLGILFVDDSEGGPTVEEWIGRLGNPTEEDVELALTQLERVRRRGWSASLHGISQDRLDDVVLAYSRAERTPEQERELLAVIRGMASRHEPTEIHPEQTYDLLHLSVPVRGRSGKVLVVLRLLELPRGATGSEVMFWLTQLQDTAAAVERRIVESARRPG